MQKTTHSIIALFALLVLSDAGSNACQAGTNPETEHPAGQHTAKPLCVLTHDGALPGHFLLLRLCQLEQQSAAAIVPSSGTPPTVTPSQPQMDAE